MESSLHTEAKETYSGLLIRQNTRTATHDEITVKANGRQFVELGECDMWETRSRLELTN